MKYTLSLLYFLSLFICTNNLGAQNLSFNHNGILRECLMHVPASYTGQTAMPLVIAIHGWKQSPAIMETQTHFSTKADKEGFIVAYPKGTGTTLQWNEANTGVDDLGFISALLDTLCVKYKIDTAMIYVTGFSNGSNFTYLVATHLGSRIAAIGPVAGPLVDADRMVPVRPMPIIHFHARDDGSITYSKVAPVLNYWIGINQCAATPETVMTVAGAVGVKWASPVKHADVILYSTDIGKHSWPGGEYYWSTPSSAINATDLMWEFFKAHPLKSTTSVQTIHGANTVKDYLLRQNYPNPFNPSTTVNFSIPERSRVTIAIYNSLGVLVDRICNEEKEAGSYSVQWHANAASGVYFCTMNAVGQHNPFSMTRVMTLLK